MEDLKSRSYQLFELGGGDGEFDVGGREGKGRRVDVEILLFC